MRLIGWGLLTAGGLLAAAGFFVSSSLGGSGYGAGYGVVNLDKLFLKQALVLSGVGTGIIGALFIVASDVIVAINRPGHFRTEEIARRFAKYDLPTIHDEVRGARPASFVNSVDYRSEVIFHNLNGTAWWNGAPYPTIDDAKRIIDDLKSPYHAAPQVIQTDSV